MALNKISIKKSLNYAIVNKNIVNISVYEKSKCNDGVIYIADLYISLMNKKYAIL
jgi:hypothetical protein